MTAFLADENLKRQITVGLRRRNPGVDLVTVQEAGLDGADDPTILSWAATENRVVLTHDVNTMTAHAYVRLVEGEPMPGLIVVPDRLPIGDAIRDLATLTSGTFPRNLELQVLHLPLRLEGQAT